MYNAGSPVVSLMDLNSPSGRACIYAHCVPQARTAEEFPSGLIVGFCAMDQFRNFLHYQHVAKEIDCQSSPFLAFIPKSCSFALQFTGVTTMATLDPDTAIILTKQ
jgi:hypothetical protein